MSARIEREIERFERHVSEPWRVAESAAPCSHALALLPKSGFRPQGKRYALTLMGLTHGNERAGVAILNGILDHLRAGTVEVRIPLAFLLGNLPAAREDKRFLERDLNRSFDRTATDTLEDRRARELETVLSDTAYILDFHQTLRASDRPFFIFPYRRESFQFARDVMPEQTIVTHWGRPFSADGRCSDEFVNARGGVGITMETGMAGFDPYQIQAGIQAGLWAIRVVESYLGVGPALSRIQGGETGPVYTWVGAGGDASSGIVPWPEEGYVELEPDWTNFKEVGQGQILGRVDGRPLTAPMPGRIIFPKYLSKEQQAALSARPAELCRIMREIDESELPKG